MKHRWMPWMMWFWPAAFYFFQSFFRSIPNAISDQLRKTFDLSVESFGILGTSFFWTYAFVQIPVGVLLDRFGPKKVLLWGSFIFVAGAFLFGTATTYLGVFLGRTLLGLGGAASFIGTIRLGTFWFAPAHVAFMIGMTTGIGKMGGASVNMLPWTWLEQSCGWDWRSVVCVIGFLIALLALGTLLFLKDRPAHLDESLRLDPPKKHMSYRQTKQALKEIFRCRPMWIVGLFTCFLYVILSAFGDIFAKDFLLSVYPKIHPDQARFYTSFLLLGNFIGSPLVAFLSDRFQRRKIFLQLSAGLLLLLVSLWIVFAQSIPLMCAVLLLFVLGVVSAAQALSFAIAGELVPKYLSGTATGFVNTLAMSGGAFLPILMGRLMSCFSADGCTTLVEYKVGMSLLCVAFLIALVLSCFIPETFPKDSLGGKEHR
jgi:MFS family permease